MPAQNLGCKSRIESGDLKASFIDNLNDSSVDKSLLGPKILEDSLSNSRC